MRTRTIGQKARTAEQRLVGQCRRDFLTGDGDADLCAEIFFGLDEETQRALCGRLGVEWVSADDSWNDVLVACENRAQESL